MSYFFQFFLDSLLLLFWIRLWTRPEVEFYFNPFISCLIRWSDQVLGFLRPALLLPERMIAFLVLVALFLLKTLILLRTGFHPELVIGGAFLFKPLATAGGGRASLPAFFLFSGMETVFFFLRLWAVFFLVQLITAKERVTRAFEAFSFLARPFSKLFRLLQPVVLILLIIGGVMVLLSNATFSFSGASSSPGTSVAMTASLFTDGPLFLRLLKTVWLSFLAVADGLPLINQALLISIVGNIVCTIFRWQAGTLLCEEGIALLLGRFRRVRIGMGFDLTPIIFFLVINLIYNLLVSLIIRLIQTPFLAFGLF